MKVKKYVLYVKEGFCYDKLSQKVKDHCHYTTKVSGAAHSNCNLQYKVPKKIPVVFHNGSTFDYHFIIKQLVANFKGQFECFGQNAKKIY